MANYTITLSRAHKVVARIQTHADELLERACRLATPVAVRSQEDAGARILTSKRIDESLALLRRYEETLDVLKCLRAAIHKTQHALGVDALLSDQKLHAQAAAYQKLLATIEESGASEWEQLPSRANENSRYTTLMPSSSAMGELRDLVAKKKSLAHAAEDALEDANQENLTRCAGSLGVQPEVESAGTAGVLMGRLLIFDVPPKNIYRRPATA